MRRLAIASRWNDILRALSGFGKRNKADASLRRRTFRFEPLEDRQLLSVCHWDGGGADNKWMTKENWVGDVAPVAGDSLYFEGTTRTATENDFTNGTSFAELCFTSSTAFSVSGNSITLPDLGIISAGCNSVSISANVAMGGMAGFQVDDDCALTMLGVLSDSGSTPGSIYKFVGGGVLTLAGANAFTGETEIEAGTLKIGNDAAIQNSSDVYVGNGTFDLNGHSVLADCLYCSESGKITSSVSGDVTLSIRTSTLGDSVCVGVIEDGLGRLSLVKVGTDTLFLGGANTYTGGTTITGGKVVINSDLALGQANGSGTFGDLTVNSGTTLDLNGHDVTVGSLRNSTSTGGIITDSTQTDGNSFVFVHQSPSVAYTGTFVNGSWTTGSGGSTTAHYRYVAPVRATGVDFFVAPADFVDPNDPTVGHGSDSNVGSWTQPWQTLRHVHDMTWSRASGIPAGGVLPNDHVYFRSGAYDVFADQNGDDAWWSITRGGAENHPIVLAACGSATVTWNTCYQLEWTWDTQRQCWSTSLAGAPMEGAAYWDSSSVFAVIKNSFRAMTMYSTATVRGIGSSSDNFYFTQESGCNDGTQLTGLYNGKPYYVDRLNWTNSPRYYLFWDGGNWRIAAHLSSADQDYWTLDVAGDPATPSLNVAFTHHGNASGSPMVTALDDPDDADGLPQDFVTPPQNQ
ncbi:MAG: autotransporter-associated beta strand repeat-containing protein, partial [Planctomycetaceae bacterium]|nr:autotransporter-associated beta strand repeat-containing protein [Planctomycetaceae bacterium]